MEPFKLKDVQGTDKAFLVEERFGRMKKVYNGHGPHQSYLTTVHGVLRENLSLFGQLVLSDVRARTKACIEWLSGEAVQPVLAAPLLPPCRTWPGVAWLLRKKEKPININAFIQKQAEEQQYNRLTTELEEARLVCNQLVQLMDNSKQLLNPPTTVQHVDDQTPSQVSFPTCAGSSLQKQVVPQAWIRQVTA